MGILKIAGWTFVGFVAIGAFMPDETPARSQSQNNILPELYQRCLDDKRANDYSEGYKNFIIEANGNFGTFDDGEIWVGYTRTIYPDGIWGESLIFRNISVICTPNGEAY